jgi:N-acetylmuramic acid 6-phosphate etherase
MPTFGWPCDRLLLFIAGGEEAMVRAKEGAEDEPGQAVDLVRRHGITLKDVLIAVAASGTTPFTLASLREAKQCDALTVGIANNPRTPILEEAEYPIYLDTGPEPIAGSTRMNAGTAQRIDRIIILGDDPARQSLRRLDGGRASYERKARRATGKHAVPSDRQE